VAWPRFEPVEPGSEELRQWLERLLAWTRRRIHVYVYYPTPPRMTKESLFRSVGLVPHADIHWYTIPKPFASVTALGSILKRRKKPFDLIVAPEARWARLANGWRWWHRAHVIPESDDAQLANRWKETSRSQS
jgi:hypothetical protein